MELGGSDAALALEQVPCTVHTTGSTTAASGCLNPEAARSGLHGHDDHVQNDEDAFSGFRDGAACVLIVLRQLSSAAEGHIDVSNQDDLTSAVSYAAPEQGPCPPRLNEATTRS